MRRASCFRLGVLVVSVGFPILIPMLLPRLQLSLLTLYALLPPALLAFAIYARLRHKRSIPILSFLLSCLTAIIAASAVLLLNRHLLAGQFTSDEALRITYLALGAVCFLKLFDRLLLRGLFFLCRVPTNPLGHPLPSARLRAAFILLAQRFLMFVFIFAYAAALIITCRPKILRDANALARYKLSSATLAQFNTRDGLLLTGWWIPAPHRPPRNRTSANPDWAADTALLCHGVGSAKEDLLPLASFLNNYGYNVLVFDFRAHGQSGGVFFSYGDRERFDVLAAARWVKANHPEQSQRLFGIGINTGAAALIAAAADSSHGRDIDGLVLYEPFARFSDLAASVANDTLPAPFAFLVTRLSLPLAGLHAGSNLRSFAPADFAPRLWPRPVLLIHGRGTTFVPITQGMDLYREISYPKEQFFPAEAYSAARNRLRRAHSDTEVFTEMFRQWLGISNPITADPGTLNATLRFLQDAHTIPVI